MSIMCKYRTCIFVGMHLFLEKKNINIYIYREKLGTPQEISEKVLKKVSLR